MIVGGQSTVERWGSSGLTTNEIFGMFGHLGQCEMRLRIYWDAIEPVYDGEGSCDVLCKDPRINGRYKGDWHFISEVVGPDDSDRTPDLMLSGYFKGYGGFEVSFYPADQDSWRLLTKVPEFVALDGHRVAIQSPSGDLHNGVLRFKTGEPIMFEHEEQFGKPADTTTLVKHFSNTHTLHASSRRLLQKMNIKRLKP